MDHTHTSFIETVWDYYGRHGRELPWRQVAVHGGIDSYHVMVSEIMLQQTQVQRVIPKYEAFLGEFPDVQTLASAPLEKVLGQWNGLGYNRRAKFLWQAAQQIVERFGGKVPDDEAALISLPGIGINTARAVMVYAYNKPLAFVETNIRTVYIHHFFSDQNLVHDRDILSIVEQTIDQEQPREWYWALMDYGTYLKKTVGNVSKNSKHYIKQSQFHGSKRQVRGEIIKRLVSGQVAYSNLKREINDDRFEEVVNDLLAEHLIKMTDQMLHL